MFVYDFLSLILFYGQQSQLFFEYLKQAHTFAYKNTITFRLNFQQAVSSIWIKF